MPTVSYICHSQSGIGFVLRRPIEHNFLCVCPSVRLSVITNEIFHKKNWISKNLSLVGVELSNFDYMLRILNHVTIEPLILQEYGIFQIKKLDV